MIALWLASVAAGTQETARDAAAPRRERRLDRVAALSDAEASIPPGGRQPALVGDFPANIDDDALEAIVSVGTELRFHDLPVHANACLRYAVGRSKLDSAAGADPRREALAARGINSGAVVANPLVSEVSNLDQGFENILDLEWSNARKVVHHALRWLDDHEDDRVLAYVHLIDPHSPYDAPGAPRDAFDVPGDPCAGRSFGELLLLLESLEDDDAAPDWSPEVAKAIDGMQVKPLRLDLIGLGRAGAPDDLAGDRGERDDALDRQPRIWAALRELLRRWNAEHPGSTSVRWMPDPPALLDRLRGIGQVR